MFDEKPSLDDLVHFGVKGMKWGVRKSKPTSSTERLRELNRKANRLNAETLIVGENQLGAAFRKQYNKAMKKNPNFDFNALTPKQQAAYRAKGHRRAYRRTLIVGAVEASAIIAGGNLAIRQFKLRPQSVQGAKASVLVLAGKSGAMRVSELHAIRTTIKFRELNAERNRLDPKQRMRSLT